MVTHTIHHKDPTKAATWGMYVPLEISKSEAMCVEGVGRATNCLKASYSELTMKEHIYSVYLSSQCPVITYLQTARPVLVLTGRFKKGYFVFRCKVSDNTGL